MSGYAWYNPLKYVAGAAKFLFGGRGEAGGTEPERFVDMFAAEFARKEGETVIMPGFVRMGYKEAVAKAKAEHRLLFVYLHSELNEDAERFCRETLCARNVVAFLGEHFVCWGARVDAPEGYSLCTAMEVSKFPFVAVLLPNADMGEMLARTVGFCDGEKMYEDLMRVQNGFGGEILANTQRREMQQEEDRLLREEQQAAFEESLREDRRREEQRRREEEEKARKEREEEERVNAARSHHEEWRDLYRAFVETEATVNEPFVSVAVRFPNGKRCTRKFPVSATMEFLFGYVDEMLEQMGEDIPMYYSLTLSVPPRTEYNWDECGQHTFGELGRNALLIFRAEEEEVDEESESESE